MNQERPIYRKILGYYACLRHRLHQCIVKSLMMHSKVGSHPSFHNKSHILWSWSENRMCEITEATSKLHHQIWMISKSGDRGTSPALRAWSPVAWQRLEPTFGQFVNKGGCRSKPRLLNTSGVFHSKHWWCFYTNRGQRAFNVYSRRSWRDWGFSHKILVVCVAWIYLSFRNL